MLPAQGHTGRANQKQKQKKKKSTGERRTGGYKEGKKERNPHDPCPCIMHHSCTSGGRNYLVWRIVAQRGGASSSGLLAGYWVLQMFIRVSSS